MLAILLFTPLLALKEGQNRLTDIAVSVFRTVHWASSTFILELQTGGKGQSSLVESEVGVFED